MSQPGKPLLTVYVSIGNSDDKLPQAGWSGFWHDTDAAIREHTHLVHGAWQSAATDPWQNAAWCFEIVDGDPATRLRVQLRKLAQKYLQHSITWALVPEVEFLS